mmetsp:Transcript_7142/g.13668  ORF Transcript_7142/g.13668 Transcript_7142/m.13668 type:complete len:136 (-) Transcript_7142:135-542(-)
MKLERLAGRHFLVYYKNKSDAKPSGQILLEQATIELDERNKKNWRIITSKRCFYLKSSSEEERKEWCVSIHKSCAQSLGKECVQSLSRMRTYTLDTLNTTSSGTPSASPRRSTKDDLTAEVGPKAERETAKTSAS